MRSTEISPAFHLWAKLRIMSLENISAMQQRQLSATQVFLTDAAMPMDHSLKEHLLQGKLPLLPWDSFNPCLLFSWCKSKVVARETDRIRILVGTSPTASSHGPPPSSTAPLLISPCCYSTCILGLAPGFQYGHLLQ